MATNRKNLASGILANSPGTSGTSFVLETGYGQTMPDVPFHMTTTPPGQLSTLGNSEIVEVTARTDDTLTVTRAQRGTTAKDVQSGWPIVNGVYVEDKIPATNVDFTAIKSTVTVSGVTWTKRIFGDGRIVYTSRHTFSGSAVAGNGWNQSISYNLPDSVVFNASTMAFAATAVSLDAAITASTGLSSNNTAILVMRTNQYGSSITTNLYTTA